MDIESYMQGVGLTNLADMLARETGYSFSAQQLNHWKRRGVPYRWHDVFEKISGIPKAQLKALSQ